MWRVKSHEIEIEIDLIGHTRFQDLGSTIAKVFCFHILE